MELTNAKLIVKRPYKEVYDCEEGIVKVFEITHPKSAVFNEALNTVRIEETGLPVPALKEVVQIDGKWSLVLEKKEGKTLEQLMEEHPERMEEYMEAFVDLQLQIHAGRAPHLNKLTDKLMHQIDNLKELDATQRYDLHMRLAGMKKHKKICHGDFNPSNVIVAEDGTMSVVDWAHVAQGNASADAAMTYLLFTLKNAKVADLYMKLFCKKSDIARQYVQQWLPIVAASQLEKDNELNKEFLMSWIDVMDFQ